MLRFLKRRSLSSSSLLILPPSKRLPKLRRRLLFRLKLISKLRVNRLRSKKKKLKLPFKPLSQLLSRLSMPLPTLEVPIFSRLNLWHNLHRLSEMFVLLLTTSPKDIRVVRSIGAPLRLRCLVIPDCFLICKTTISVRPRLIKPTRPRRSWLSSLRSKVTKVLNFKPLLRPNLLLLVVSSVGVLPPISTMISTRMSSPRKRRLLK
mmetsp:Transcript_27920/g.37826  ORF Transcript_27920/g.37826 Transcript_27920/m.37826 type:complete len:205 (+) Transcript_27920:2036-2650(+)